MINEKLFLYIFFFAVIIFALIIHFISNKKLKDKVYKVVSVTFGVISCMVFIAYGLLFVYYCFQNFSFKVAKEELTKKTYDYSTVKTAGYEKITIEKSSGEVTDIIVTLSDNESVDLGYPYGLRKNIRHNNKYFKNCFVRKGEVYKVTGKLFYLYDKFDYDTIYVDEKNYDKIYGKETDEICFK